MDQDFFIEESSPFKIIFTLLFVIIVIVGIIYGYFNYSKKSTIKLKNVTIELGEELPQDKEFYLIGEDINNYTIDLSNVSTENNKVNSVGEYSYKVKSTEKELKGKIYVKDTTKPIVEVQNLEVGLNEEFEPSEFVTKCEDLSIPCKIKYKKSSDADLVKKEGNYNITLIIKDNEDNEVEKVVSLTVSKEKTLEGKKSGDLTYHHNSMINDTWDKTYTLKLEKAINEETVEFEKLIADISKKEYVFDKNISNKEIIILYNQYDYVLGFSLMITFEDESIMYVTNENAQEVTEETENPDNNTEEN